MSATRTSMKPPFILWIRDEDTVEVFSSADRLVGQVESPDVDDGVYSAFDSEGRLLTLKVDRTGDPPKRRRWFGGVDLEPVVLQETEPEPTNQEELRLLLIRTLERRGIPRAEVQGNSLSELLAHPSLAPRH